MTHAIKLVQEYILRQVENDVMIFDALQIAEELSVNERQAREAIYKLQRLGHPITHKKRKLYIYHIEKEGKQSQSDIRKEAKSKHKRALSSFGRYWGLIKSLPAAEQQSFRDDILEMIGEPDDKSK